MSENVLTLREVAEELGVHYMTAYRYVRLGVISAYKDGVNWQIERADLETFRSGGRTALADGGRGGSDLDGSDPVGSDLDVLPAGRARGRTPWSERLQSRLEDGDLGGAWSVVQAALASGYDPNGVYLELLAPALARIGERWQRGELGVAEGHVAAGVAVRLVGQLGPRFRRRGRSRGRVAIGCPAGEWHSLSAAVVADVLRGCSFDVVDLGPDVPADVFASVVAEQRFSFVGLSWSTPGLEDAVRRTITAIRTQGDVPVLLGGGASSEDSARVLGADHHARDGRELISLAERLFWR
ncbi:MAG: cobalamin-dependent protein [Actinomycetota bacterium]|nr:cobalamin-dependent protein [Actinomycetota bacterium]